MEVRPGYKQTRVGVIPVEWAAEELGPYVVINSGESPSKYRFTSEGIPYFKVGELDNDYKYLRETPYFIDGSERVPRGSLIFPKRGASIMLNKVRILAEDSFMDTNLMTLTPRDGLDAEYLYYALLHVQLWRVADTTSIPQINNKHIRALAIPIPPMREQRTIASVLSDVDALIAALDRLIAKKRAIKRGAMQQLLTGRTRLPGFSGAWEVKALGEIGQINVETLTSSTDVDYSFEYISLEDVDAGVVTGSSNLVFGSAPSRARRKVRKNDVLVSTVRPNLKSHYLVRREVSDLICSTGFCVLRCNQIIAEPAYVYFHLFGDGIEQQIESLLTGSNYPAINSSDVKALQIPIPSLPEQRAIAAVLSDMDAEIAALKARRDKTRALKKGMMQELLTGKTRLM